MHTRSIEFPFASSVVWPKPNVPVTGDHGVSSFAAFPKEEYAMFNLIIYLPPNRPGCLDR